MNLLEKSFYDLVKSRSLKQNKISCAISADLCEKIFYPVLSEK